jgi:hypothetical protein
MFLPEAVEGSVKFGQQGLVFNFSSASLSEKVKSDLSVLAEHSIARKTWSTYRSAEKMLATFCMKKSYPLELPISEETMLGFIHWLLFERNLMAASVSGYLAGIRKLHIVKGLPEPTIRTRMVQMILDGKKNMEAAAGLKGDVRRGPVTHEIMTLLKARIREWQTDNVSKVTLWAVSTLLFHGAFRGGELLSRTASTFDPAYTLLRRDVVVVEDSCGQAVVQVNIKAPKEEKSRAAVIVDVYQTDTTMCPAKAVMRWLRMTEGMAADMPAFRLADGTPVTGSLFNLLLKEWLGDTVPGISAHSFRIGAASLMGKLGFSDKDVQAVGRWGSRAFEGYMRLPRTKRRLVARKLAKYNN